MCLRIIVVVLTVLSAPQEALAEWFYTLGQQRQGQQVNICDNETEILRIAGVFERRGPRPGYHALTNSEFCTVRVESLVPLDIIAQVVVARDEPNQYTVSFLRVRLSDETIYYLVTTRPVRVVE